MTLKLFTTLSDQSIRAGLTHSEMVFAVSFETDVLGWFLQDEYERGNSFKAVDPSWIFKGQSNKNRKPIKWLISPVTQVSSGNKYWSKYSESGSMTINDDDDHRLKRHLFNYKIFRVFILFLFFRACRVYRRSPPGASCLDRLRLEPATLRLTNITETQAEPDCAETFFIHFFQSSEAVSKVWRTELA